MMPLMEDRRLLQDRLLQALAAAKAIGEVDENKIAAVGFCFGGLCALDLARTGADVQAVASFHGMLKPAPNMKGSKI
jgi:dienelactone hydrolase